MTTRSTVNMSFDRWGESSTGHPTARLAGALLLAIALASLVAAVICPAIAAGARGPDKANGPKPRSSPVRSETTSPPPPPSEGGAVPNDWTRFTSFESDLNSGTDFGWVADSPFSVTRTSEAGAADGSSAAKIVTNGGNSGCSCPRMTYAPLSYGAGQDVWIGGAWRITDPTKVKWSRLMNLGHYEGSADPDNWYLALMVRDAGMEVVARRFDTDTGASVLMAPRAIPVNQWFKVDVHLKLSPNNGEALTEVYVNGQLVSTSTNRNMLSTGTLHFFNAGLPYFWSGNGNTTVYLDAPRIRG